MNLKQLHESTDKKFLLVKVRSNSDAFYFADELLEACGFKKIGQCTDLDQSDDWDDSIEYSSTDLEDIQIWSNGAAPSQQELIDALLGQQVIEHVD